MNSQSAPIAVLLLTAAIAWPQCSRATSTCEQLKTAITEGSSLYHEPVPKFELSHVSSADGNSQYFAVSMFKDVRALISCRHGLVETFAADANSNKPASVLHAMILAGAGLHGFGLDWKSALETREELVRTAKISDRQTSEVHVEGGNASLIISAAGVPSFEIDTDR